MSYIRFFISLKIPDNVARTALHSIQSRMGYPTLRELRRSDYWELSFPQLNPQEARQAAERLLLKTAYFMNPNKHRWVMQESQTSFQSADGLVSPFTSDVSILVCDRIDGKAESTLSSLRKITQGSEQPAALHKGVWWDLSFDGLDPDQALQAAEDLAVSKSRLHGIFANPHYQECKIYPAR